MALNDKLIQLKNNISSFKQNMASAISTKGGNVTSASTLDEMISSVNVIGGGKLKWFDGIKFSQTISDSQLEGILSGVDFSEVTDFEGLLRDRSSFTTFPAFDTSKAKNLNNLFRNCTNLVSLPYFNVENASNIEGMIEGCSKLTDVGGFGGLKENFKFVMNSNLSHDSLMNIINNLATVSGKQLAIGQNNRDRLTDEEISIATNKGWNVVVKLPYTSGLFANDSTTTDDLLENVFQAYDTANISSFDYMFRYCSSITRIPQLDTSSGTIFDSMFSGCSSLTSIPHLNTSCGTGFDNMFRGCSSLTSIPHLNTSCGTRFDSMFSGCSSLTSIPHLNTSCGTGFDNMFRGCSSLTDIPHLNTSCGTGFDSMFYECKSLTSISELNTSRGTGFGYMFHYCSSLTVIPKLDTSRGNSFNSMLNNCRNLKRIEELSFKSLNETVSAEYLIGYSNTSILRYVLIKDIGTCTGMTSIDFNYFNNFGVEDESITEYIGARKSLVDTLLTYSFDRATAEYSTCTIILHDNTKSVLTEEEIAAISAKGYTIA